MSWGNLSRWAHVSLLVIAALVCFLGGFLFGDLVYSLFGHDCPCTHISAMCGQQCLSVLGISIPESIGKTATTLLLPLVGTAWAQSLLSRADNV